MSDQTMTIGITGPRRRAPWRGAVMVLIIAAIVLSICLILLGLTGDFLVDWLWFSTIGYLGVFWTTIAAEAEVFSLQPHLQILRRSCRPLLCGMEQARRPALAHYVHRTAPMGPRVLINGIWYKSVKAVFR